MAGQQKASKPACVQRTWDADVKQEINQGPATLTVPQPLLSLLTSSGKHKAFPAACVYHGPWAAVVTMLGHIVAMGLLCRVNNPQDSTKEITERGCNRGSCLAKESRNTRHNISWMAVMGKKRIWLGLTMPSGMHLSE